MDMGIARVAAPLHLASSARPTGGRSESEPRVHGRAGKADGDEDEGVDPRARPTPCRTRPRATTTPGLEIGGAVDGRSVNGGAAKPHARAAAVEDQGWELLRESVVRYCGSPVGTIAASDPDDPTPLNYDQVFIRDFVPSGVAFLLTGEHDIVLNFILHTLQLQSWEKTMDCHSPGQGLSQLFSRVMAVHIVEGIWKVFRGSFSSGENRCADWNENDLEALLS